MNKLIEKTLQFLIFYLQKWQNRESLKTLGAARSSQWGKVRDAHLLMNPECAVCGTKKSLQVHHIQPFHLFPHLELAASNLIALCDDRGCHLRFGHLYNFSSYNDEIRKDAAEWHNKIISRP